MIDNKDRATKFKGITKNRHSNLYGAHLYLRIGRDSRVVMKYIGCYKTPEEAYIARCRYIDSLK